MTGVILTFIHSQRPDGAVCSATALIVYVFGLRFISFWSWDFGLWSLQNSKMIRFVQRPKTKNQRPFYSKPISTRGLSSFSFEYCLSSSFVSSEITFGNVTCTSTN